MAKNYRIECEECDSVTIVSSYGAINYCPACGRRAEPEEIEIPESVDQAGWDPWNEDE